MPTSIDEAGPRDAAAWDAFATAHPGASVYHLWGWRRIFEDVFSHRPVYLLARRDGEVAGILPLVHFDSWIFGRFLVSLPFVNYGGVLAVDDDAAAQLVEAARRHAAREKARHVELRHCERRFAALPARSHKVAMILALRASPDEQWGCLDRKVRNQVRKAEKSGLEVTTGGSELVGGFYGVFARNMHDLGTPVYSRELFAAVLSVFPHLASVAVVRRGPAVIAGGLSLTWQGRTEVPWASSLAAFRTLAPNTLLYWALIRHAIERGSAAFDFGRSSPDSGTFHFKRQWGAEPSPLHWEYVLLGDGEVPDQGPSNPKFKLAVAAWKRLPVFVTNRLGPRIVRAIP